MFIQTDQEKLNYIEDICSQWKNKRDTVFRLWRDVRNGDGYEGNCQDFMWTVAKVYFGGTLAVWLAILTLRVKFLRGRSVKNRWYWPRHAVLYIPELGYIDSNDRYWRESPEPTKIWYSIGAPLLVFLGLFIAFHLVIALWKITAVLLVIFIIWRLL